MKRKNHGFQASLHFARRPWFRNSRRQWYNYCGEVTGSGRREGRLGWITQVQRNRRVFGLGPYISERVSVRVPGIGAVQGDPRAALDREVIARV